jgi:glutamate/tyrosine decarboxylase-like PLP-dependent enzyme
LRRFFGRVEILALNVAKSRMDDQCHQMGIVTALFPDSAESARIASHLDAALTGLADALQAGHVAPDIDLAFFRGELRSFTFENPMALDTLLDWTIDRLSHGNVQITHPRYFGLFNPAPTIQAECADRIAGAFNPQLASATTSPVATLIEAHAINAVIARAGLPATASGHFTSGGSEANFTALICALTAHTPDFAHTGARCFDGQPTFYVSRESHLAWIKIAHMAGIGRAGVRLVATDGTGRMSDQALDAAIMQDIGQGCRPVMVAATAGTTGGGMIDPLPACAAIAQLHGLWLHIDAAWGGAAIASDKIRPALRGIEDADSLTIDAHKWFATTMGCGMFATRHAAVLPAAFNAANDFMPPSGDRLDPYLCTAQWSRRFLGLRLFLSLAAVGWDGYAAHVDRAVALAAFLADTMTRRGWRVANASPLAVLCLVPPHSAASPATIVDRVVRSGKAWVSKASFEGHEVVRACITNGRTTEGDVVTLADALDAAACP